MENLEVDLLCEDDFEEGPIKFEDTEDIAQIEYDAEIEPSYFNCN